MTARISLIGTSLFLVAILGTAPASAREEKVPLDRVPAPVMDTVKARFANASIKGAAKETEKGKPVYEITLSDKGRNVDVTLTPNGDLVLIEKAIDKAELPAPVVQSLTKSYPGATYAVVEEIVEVDKGHEHLAFYEVALATADGHKREVKLTPAGGAVAGDEDEEGESEDDD